MTVLGLGTAQFGLDYGITNVHGRPSAAEAGAILALAAARGVAVIDTAAAYGSAEAVIADALPAVHGFRIVTKTRRLDGDVAATLARLEDSVARLGSALDTVLVHAAGDLAGPLGRDLWDGLEGARSRGSIRRIGFSAYVEDEPAELARRLRPDVVQVPVSVFDQRLLRDGSLEAMKAQGVEVHARSLFLQGLALAGAAALPPGLSDRAAILDGAHAAWRAAGVAPLAAALGFIRSCGLVDVAIVGVARAAELAEILEAWEEQPRLTWPAFALDDPVLLNPARWPAKAP